MDTLVRVLVRVIDGTLWVNPLPNVVWFGRWRVLPIGCTDSAGCVLILSLILD